MSSRTVAAGSVAGSQASSASGAGQDLPAGAEIAVELGLDRVEQFRDMLVLVDQDRLARLDEPAGIGPNRRPRGGIVAVDHPLPELVGQFAEQQLSRFPGYFFRISDL
jgi:hypothetical protein